MINHDEISSRRTDNILIGDDALGLAIQTAEEAYVKNGPIIEKRIRTNELIEDYQDQGHKLDRTLAVRINNHEFNHLVLGEYQDKNSVFGLVNTDSENAQTIRQEVDSEQIRQVYSQLKMLR